MLRYLTLLSSLILMASCSTLFTKKYQGGIPERRPDALTGSQFIRSIKSLNEFEREINILRQLRRGNIPKYLRKLKSVAFSKRLPNGKVIKGKIWVTPDYLAVGSNSDFVRIPMNPITAQRVADHYGFILPTTKIVDQI